MAFIDYYKILGVNKNIPQKDVRAAYRRRAKQFHPDLHPNDPKAKAKFQALSEAYDVIGNPEKRAKYDKYGEQWRNAEAYENFGGRATEWDNRGGASPFDGFDFNSFSSEGFSSFFQDLFGMKEKRQNAEMYMGHPKSEKVADRKIKINLDFYTAILGGEIILSLSPNKKIKLKVKPYTQNGSKVRLKDKGYDRGNGTYGDLIITYNVTMPTSLNQRQKDLLRQMKNAQ